MDRSIDDDTGHVAGRYARGLMLGLSLLGVLAATAGCERGAATVAPADAHARTRIVGTLHGADGRVLPMAHVRVIDPATAAADTVAAGRGGRFRLSTRRTGFALLEFTGVDHAQLRVPVWLDGSTLELEVRLGTYAPAGPDDTLRALVWSGSPASSPPQQLPLVRGTDGHARVEIAGGVAPLRVQLTGLAGEGRAMNVPGTDRFEYDGGGDYLSVMPVARGKLVLDVDLARAPKGVESQLHFADPQALAARVAALGEHWPPRASSDASDATALWRVAAAGELPQLRRAATAMALELDAREFSALSAGEQALAIEAVERSAFGDTLWGLAPRGLVSTAQASGRAELVARVERVLGEQLPAEATGMLLIEQLAQAADSGDMAGRRRVWAQLQQPRYAELGLLEVAAAWRPDRKVERGGQLPAFAAPGLVDAAAPVSNRDLGGKVVLIELWATWCGPCVEAMPELHALHERFGGPPAPGRPGFEIVSISMDERADDVIRFRETWPMPWTHAFAGEARDRLYEVFETGTLPYAVLVDERGTILEAAAQLDAPHLRELLSAHLDARAAAAAAPTADAAP